MFESKLVSHLYNQIPEHLRIQISKYVYIIGFDKLTKKGLLKDYNLQKLKLYAHKIKQKGRITPQNPENQQLKQEIMSLKREISKLAQKITTTSVTKQDKKTNSHSQKKGNSIQINAKQNIQDLRNRSSSMDYRKQKQQSQSHVNPNGSQNIKKDEITPKVTEVVPSQIFQNFNINIQKHHLDDTEIKGVFQNQYMVMLNSASKKNTNLKSKPPINNKSLIIPSNILLNVNKSQIHPQTPLDSDKSEMSLKEQFENSMQVNKKINFDNLRQQKAAPQRDTRPGIKKIIYDPKGNISDLSYKQIQPESKIKPLIAEAKKAYKVNQPYFQQDQQEQQEDSQDIHSLQNATSSKVQDLVQDNTMNTAQFSNKYERSQFSDKNQQRTQSLNKYPLEKNMIDEQDEYQQGSQQQNFNYKKIEDNLYKSTVTSLMNEDDSYISMNKQNSQLPLRQPKQQHSSSQQGTKRSALSKDDKSQSNSPQVDNNFRLRDRLQQPQQKQSTYQQKESIYQQKDHSYTQKESLYQQKESSYQQKENSYQKFSVESSDQKINDPWEGTGLNYNAQVRSGFGRDMDDYNRSSVSSNFSVFNPNEDLKNFFQKDFIERQIGYANSIESSQSYDQEHKQQQVFKKKPIDISQDEIGKSNVFNNNRLSVTRILSNQHEF